MTQTYFGNKFIVQLRGDLKSVNVILILSIITAQAVQIKPETV